MADVQIVCATHGRAGQVTAFEVFGDDLLLSVAKSQEKAYRKAYPKAKIDVHPDSVVGLPQKKNWLYDKFGDVFVVDDDVQPMIDHQEGKKVEPAKAVELVHHVADMAEQMGCYLFGFNDDAMPLHYSPQRPFEMTGMCCGGKFGLLKGSGLWWPEDPKMGMAEDIWMGALNAYTHRKILRTQRYCLPTGLGQAGGLSSTRSMKTMKEVADFLVKNFGEAIVMKDEDQAALYYWRLKLQW